MTSTATKSSSNERRKYHTVKECQVCGARSQCGESDDGTLAMCWNVVSEYKNSLGAYRHRLTADPISYVPTSKQPFAAVPRKPKKEHRYPFCIAKIKSKVGSEGLHRWSERRCIPVQNYQDLGCTTTPRGLLIPERNPVDPTNICGYSERFSDPISV